MFLFFFFSAQKPKVSENDFEDLLPNQGFSKSDKKGPKTMAEMRKQELARDTDPLKLKVGDSRAPARDLLCIDLAPGGSWSIFLGNLILHLVFPVDTGDQ